MNDLPLETLENISHYIDLEVLWFKMRPVSKRWNTFFTELFLRKLRQLRVKVTTRHSFSEYYCTTPIVVTKERRPFCRFVLSSENEQVAHFTFNRRWVFDIPLSIYISATPHRRTAFFHDFVKDEERLDQTLVVDSAPFQAETRYVIRKGLISHLGPEQLYDLQLLQIDMPIAVFLRKVYWTRIKYDDGEYP